MAIFIDRDQYRRTHGKNPKGYGTWIFTLVSSKGCTDIWRCDDFGAALQSAKLEANTVSGVYEIIVRD